MAQLVVAAAGAAIGGMIAPGVVAFGMTGAAMGWMAGSVVGSMFAPTQKSEGPRLGDLSVSGSSYGTPIPWVAGSPRISGTVVWSPDKVREIASTQSAGGKGGGGSEYTSYTYETDLLILLTDNEMAGVPQAWRNGELVYSILSDADDATIEASVNSGPWSRFTVYTGAADQLPDPDYEAAVGTANAPAYRGRCTVFIKSLQLGNSNQIPNLTFRVASSAELMYTRAPWLLCHFDQMNGSKVLSEAGPDLTAGGALQSTITKFGAAAGGAGGFSCNSATGVLDPAKSWRAGGWFYPTYWLNTYVGIMGFSNSVGNRSLSISFTFQFGYLNYQYSFVNLSLGASGVLTAVVNGKPSLNTWSYIELEYNSNTGNVVLYQNGYRQGVICNGNFNVGSTKQTFSNIGVGGANGICDEFYYREIEDSELHPVVADNALAYSVPSGPFVAKIKNTPTYLLSGVPLPDVVTDVMLRAGYATDQFDVSALPTTKVVRALANSTVSTARTVLEMLASTYFFDTVCPDKIYFVPRGGAPVATISWDELGVTADSTNAPDPLPITIANELEIPAQMALTYNNVDGDYQTDTQYSDRLLTGQESTSAVQVPMGFTAAEAKAVVDALLLDKAVSALSTSINVDITRAALVPTDVVQVVGEDGSTYRIRISKRTDAGGVTTLALVGDDASVLVQAGVTSGGTASQTTVLPVASTTMALLDVPLLRDADDKPGLYVAVMGNAANWAGCAIYESLDDVTYTQVTTLADQTAIGTCTTVLGDWTGGNVFDESNTVTVNVGAIQQLASVSRDDILANPAINAALIGAELVQYLRATLVSAGVYTLSGLLRGRRGTEWASVGHVAAERFVALGASGLRFLTLQSSDLGRLRYYKGVSAGQKLSDVTAQAITPAGVALECLSPVNARADRATTDTVLTWTRRTRLSTRLTGSLPINAPLGEVAEAYDLEVWDSTYTTLKRTLSASSPTATYTSAQQVADFGANQAALYLKIYQLSATVARGYPLKVSV